MWRIMLGLGMMYKTEDAGETEFTVGRMQVMVEAVDETADFRSSAGDGVLPTDGRVHSESWSVPGWNMPCGHYWGRSTTQMELVATAMSSREVDLEEFLVKSDGSFEATGLAEAEGDGDIWCGTTATAAAPAGMAGAAKIPGDADDVGASVGADGGSGVATVPECG